MSSKTMSKTLSVIVILICTVLSSYGVQPDGNPIRIPPGSKIYVAPMGGFENYVIAGILNKKVPVVLVTDRGKADYEIRGSAETQQAGLAKIVFLRTHNTNHQPTNNTQEIKPENMPL